MSPPATRDLLIECKGCGVENLFRHYTPETPTVCNQCREWLLTLDFNQTHNEFLCEDCGFTLLLLKETPFQAGRSTCRCESRNLIPVENSPLAEKAAQAGALGPDEAPDPDSSEEFDWCRSEPNTDIEDYNEMFDNDPGTG